MMLTKRQCHMRDALLAKAQSDICIMGILNTTPDSFSDGGQLDTLRAVAERAETFINEGADILDIGGESTRPGAELVAADVEIQRTEAAIAHLYETTETPLSIDTYKSQVAAKAAKSGAVLINDVWGLSRDPDMADIVAETGCAVIINYNRGQADETINLVDDARAFFDAAFAQADQAGIPKAHIWLDPGVGFGKTLAQNFEILQRLDVLLDYERPVLVGLSRKSFIGLTLDIPVEARLPGTLAANLAAVHEGANVLRVHDVAAHRDAVTIYKKIRPQ